MRRILPFLALFVGLLALAAPPAVAGDVVIGFGYTSSSCCPPCCPPSCYPAHPTTCIRYYPTPTYVYRTYYPGNYYRVVYSRYVRPGLYLRYTTPRVWRPTAPVPHRVGLPTIRHVPGTRR